MFVDTPGQGRRIVVELDGRNGRASLENHAHCSEQLLERFGRGQPGHWTEAVEVNVQLSVREAAGDAVRPMICEGSFADSADPSNGRNHDWRQVMLVVEKRVEFGEFDLAPGEPDHVVGELLPRDITSVFRAEPNGFQGVAGGLKAPTLFWRGANLVKQIVELVARRQGRAVQVAVQATHRDVQERAKFAFLIFFPVRRSW